MEKDNGCRAKIGQLSCSMNTLWVVWLKSAMHTLHMTSHGRWLPSKTIQEVRRLGVTVNGVLPKAWDGSQTDIYRERKQRKR